MDFNSGDSQTPQISSSNQSPKNNPGNSPDDTKAITAFILGLVGIIAWCFPLIGFPVALAGIIFGILGLKSENKKVFSVIGLILSGISFIATIINAIAGAVYFSNAFA
ncbi:MAG: DUF4190 domain-containing protein [bacterium]|nr:DUF4190 domain-containing protein [bacterium]